MSVPQQPPQMQSFPPNRPKPPRKGLRALGWTAVSVAAVFVLFMAIGVIGAMASGGLKSAAVTAPAPTVTVSVPGPERTVAGPEKTVTATVPGPTMTETVPGPTQTVTVSTTPQSCRDALLKAEKVMDDATQGFTAIGTGLTSFSRTSDTSYLTDTADKLRVLGPVVGSDRAAYDAAASACRGQ